MFEISVTETFIKLYKKLPKTIQKKSGVKTKLLRENPFHSTLRTKKLAPHHEEVWSFWVDHDYRIKFRFASQKTIHFLFIGHRKDIYS